MNVSIYEPVNGVTWLTNAPTLTARAGFHIHGSSTESLPKHAFSVEFWDELEQLGGLFAAGLAAGIGFCFVCTG